MTNNAFHIELSPLDEQRFGIPAARAINVASDNLPHVMEFCRAHQVEFLVARCSTSDLSAAQAMEQEGFLLMDTLIYWVRQLAKYPIPAVTDSALIRSARAEDAHQVRAVAVDSFRGYFGHYHADPRLDRQQCNDAYVSWAERSVMSRDVADEVFVAELDGSVVGFATLRMNTPQEGEGVLFGVAPEAQGRGIYRSFIVRGMAWCLANGAARMVVSTQITNLAVQKVWARVGFEPSHSYYTFHKWFV